MQPDTLSLQLFNFFVLRAPALPYNEFLDLHDQFHDNVEGLIKQYKEIFSDPALQEAVYLASQDLYQELKKWLDADDCRRDIKMLTTLYKYYSRMCTRCTPFGAFSGCALGEISWEGDNDLHLETIEQYQVTSIDMQCIGLIAEGLSNINETVFNETVFYSNSSLYALGNTFRYYEYKLDKGKRKYYLSSFTNNEYADKIIKAASDGATIGRLSTLLASLGISSAESQEYLKSLIEHQILISEYAPLIVGGKPFSKLVTQVQSKAGFPPSLSDGLQLIQERISASQHSVALYEDIKDSLKNIGMGKAVKEIIHADSFFKMHEKKLNQTLLASIISSIEQLSVFQYYKKEPNADLQKFKTAFLQKYEDKWVPLAEALDAESGIGYGIVTGENSNFTPLIDNLLIPGKQHLQSTEWTPVNRLILKKYLNFVTSNIEEIAINDEDIDWLKKKLELLPEQPRQNTAESFTIMGTLLDDPHRGGPGNCRFLLKACGGVDALSLLARFGAKQTEIRDAMKTCVDYEKERLDPDKVFAEIIHIPEGEIGNILLRPALFDYEIPFLGPPSVEKEFVIHLQDLFISIKNGKIILRSKSLNKEILPRLTSAHNFENGLPVYKFLCEMQQQEGQVSISWNWGFLKEQPFLPRVTFKNIVLQRARWYIDKEALSNDNCLPDSATAFAALKQRFKLPDLILLVEGDNELFLDLSLPVCSMILLKQINKGHALLYEFAYNQKSSMLRCGKKLYSNEIIIPVKNIIDRPETKTNCQIPEKLLYPSYSLGSEWIYLKLYTGSKWADNLLGYVIKKLIKKLQRKLLLKKWFFIRYNDPENHIRLRLKIADYKNNFQRIISEINRHTDDYLQNKIIRQLVYDTYIPEIEKYGRATMEISETFFSCDSKFVIDLVHFSLKEKNDEYRWMFGIKGVDLLLTDAGFTLQQKFDFCLKCQLSFFTEFNGNKFLADQLNNKYRNNKNTIQDILTNSKKQWSAKLLVLFQQKSKSNQDILKELKFIIASCPEQVVQLEDLLNNYIHLYLNRLYIANQRLHELVTYYYLVKFYESALVRQRLNLPA